ncbi:ribonuclease [Neosynechococcus sphagnicola sy1]|uniref:Ribonuclease 3 n=1 Tax=Neosynechococcus sphagnicola sy1 TaxID=1497020 RepID=A0A098TJP5_9CYAN|nr:ribonuclease III [Neosynechococcus sphagnicola]KGF72544.1 ribonuclease [Neosynechococcus sphagnicola sy1]
MPLPYPHRQQQLQRLIRHLGLGEVATINWQLLDLALTHPTISAEFNYDRLEFVGDAVVRMAVAEFLWNTYPTAAVGEYAAVRSILVSDRTLAQLAAHYDLEHYLLVSASALRDKAGEESRWAEAFEALLGALYLSVHTLELIHPWLEPHLQRLTTEIRRDPALQNYKAALQEWTQAHYRCLPEYRVQETDPPRHDNHRFRAEVWLSGQLLGQGQGRSIKAAEQAAAQVAFTKIQS